MKATQTSRPFQPQIPPRDLADVALVDIKEVCSALSMSASWVHNEVRERRFPQPLRHGPRCTRWRAVDIRQYLIERAAQPQAEAVALVTARASKASVAAQVKRAAAATAAKPGGAA